MITKEQLQNAVDMIYGVPEQDQQTRLLLWAALGRDLARMVLEDDSSTNGHSL